MKPIILIHPFQVNLQEEQNFLYAWQRVDDYMKKQPGFIETKLHRSLNIKGLAAFSFINIATWKNASLFHQAISNAQFTMLAQPVLSFSCRPGLYEAYI